MSRSVLPSLLLVACASTGATPDELPSVEEDALLDPAPTLPDDEPPPPRARLPEWVDARLDAAAVSLIGGDEDSIEILVGQFEHPQEAIIRFDRETGCASEVIGPWPTLSKIVMGRAGFDGPRLGPADLLAAANDGALADELASIVPIYAQRDNSGEDKLQFSRDGQHLVMSATDERMIASSDGGTSWRLVDGAFVDMAAVSPEGTVAVVRPCTKGSCGGPAERASYSAALLRFDDLPATRPIAGATLLDAVFDPTGASVTLARSNAFGRRAPSRICLERYELPDATTSKSLGCVATSVSGYWHMLSVSPDRGTAAIATSDRDGAVTLTVRSLRDGSELEAFDVPGSWETYQWVDVHTSNDGTVAYRVGADSGGPLGDPSTGTMVVRGRGIRAVELARARPLGWLDDGELVWLDRSTPLDEYGCGLVKAQSF